MSVCNGTINGEVQTDKSVKMLNNNQRKSLDPVFGKNLEPNIDYKIIDEEKKQNVFEHASTNNATEKLILVNIWINLKQIFYS